MVLQHVLEECPTLSAASQPYSATGPQRLAMRCLSHLLLEPVLFGLESKRMLSAAAAGVAAVVLVVFADCPGDAIVIVHDQGDVSALAPAVLCAPAAVVVVAPVAAVVVAPVPAVVIAARVPAYA